VANQNLTVNPQIIDAISVTTAANIGESASLAMGMFFQVEAQAFGMGMQNAVSAQQGQQQVGQAITGVACTRIMQIVEKATASK
jgi:hypothetical protein